MMRLIYKKLFHSTIVTSYKRLICFAKVRFANVCFANDRNPRIASDRETYFHLFKNAQYTFNQYECYYILFYSIVYRHALLKAILMVYFKFHFRMYI